ncbi:organic cation transporter protein-like [Schistocerca nitens]|uniref:organic cation transporter protein-like n=1 Tax=Schistocerca nitens TaxID=7011 RepID=UPI002118E4A2|nr:organic cation transporter protein-like [Schistocerca nitens]
MEWKKRQPWHLFLLVSLVKIPSAWQMASILFIGPDKLPGTYHCSGHVLSNGYRRNDPCHTYVRKNITLLSNSNSSEGEETTFCEDFRFTDTYYSIVDQWQLVCQRKILVSVSQLLYLMGVLFGGVACTFLLWIVPPDVVLIGGTTVQILAGVAVAFTPYFVLHCLLRFLTAAACTCMFTSGYMICTTMMKGKGKIVASCCYEHLWSVGVITLPCIAHLFNDWRHFQLAISLPSMVILLCARFVPNCPGWEPRKKKKQRAIEVGQDASPPIENQMKVAVIALSETSAKDDKMSLPPLRKSFRRWSRYAAVHCIWIFTLVSYYGGLLNAKNWGSSLLINTIGAGVAEIAGTLLGLSLLLWASNSWLPMGIINITGGSVYILSWILPDDTGDLYYVLLMVAMFGRVAIATCLTVVTFATGSVFAESHRVLGVFSCVTLGRCVLLFAPFIGNLAVFGKAVPLTVFGAFAVLGGLFALILTACSGDIDGAGTESVEDKSQAAENGKKRANRSEKVEEGSYGTYRRRMST